MASKNWVRAITATAAVGLLIPVCATGQGRGATTTPPPTGGGNTTGTTPGTTTPSPGRTTTPTNTNPTNPTHTPTVSIPQPIFISGRVMMEDGTPPPDPVVIETVCNGSPHGEGYSDTKGYFSIELGTRNGMMRDASEFSSFNRPGAGYASMGSGSSGLAVPNRRAQVHGLRSAGQTTDAHKPCRWPDGARWTIPTLRPFCCIATDPLKRENDQRCLPRLRRKTRRRAYEKGLEAIKKRNSTMPREPGKAVRCIQYSTAWYGVGMLQASQGKMDMTRKYSPALGTIEVRQP